jgi:hypothetical protein
VPRVCTVCSHPDVAGIDQALVAGGVNRRIAAQYGLTEASVRRHKEEHVPAKIAKAKKAQTVADADDLLHQAGALRTKAMSLLLKAEAAGDYRTALAGIREARGCLELLARLMGELNDQANINVIVAPVWIELRAAVFDALQPYPDARIAVAERLHAVAIGTETAHDFAA